MAALPDFVDTADCKWIAQNPNTIILYESNYFIQEMVLHYQFLVARSAVANILWSLW